MDKTGVDRVLRLCQDLALVIKEGGLAWELLDPGASEDTPSKQQQQQSTAKKRQKVQLAPDHHYYSKKTKIVVAPPSQPNEADVQRLRREARQMELEDRATRVVGTAMLAQAWGKEESRDRDAENVEKDKLV